MRQIESIFWGIVAALGALFVQLVFYIGSTIYMNPEINIPFETLYSVPQFLILAAFIEELFKYIIIAKRIDNYSLEKTYIINSLLVGFGFFMTELAVIASNSAGLPNISVLAEIAIIHIGTSGIIGYIVATKNPKRFSTFVSAIATTLTFHVAYNLLTINRIFVANIAIYSILTLLIVANLINFLLINKKVAR